MGDKIRFYPLDVMYKVIDGKPVIHLFSRTDDNRQICILYDKFEPYFYVIPKKGADIADELNALKIIRNGQTFNVAKTEHVKKKYFGKEVNAIKVFTKLPSDIPMLRKELKKLEGVESVNENDILFVKRYMIDNNIVPRSE